MSDNKVVKSFTCEVKEIDAENMTAWVYASTASVDRDKEVIDPQAFVATMAEFMKHPILLANHDYYSLQMQIGEVLQHVIAPDHVKFQVKYYAGAGNAEADWGWYLAQQGKASYSIGFIAQQWVNGDESKDGWRRKFTAIELLELSHVTIPSNRDALQAVARSAKGYAGKLPEQLGEAIGKEFPEGVEEKAGRTLSAKNEAALREAVAAIDTATAALKKVLAAVEVAYESAENNDEKQAADVDAARKMAEAYFSDQAQGESRSAKVADDENAELARELAELNRKLTEANHG